MRCTDPNNPHPTYAQTLRAWARGGAPGCGNPARWYAHPAALFLTVLAGTAAAAHHRNLQLLPASTDTLRIAAICTALAIVAGLYEDVVAPNTYHASCDECGLCSVTAGVPAARTSQRHDKNLTVRGWSVCDEHVYCPEHAHLHPGGWAVSDDLLPDARPTAAVHIITITELSDGVFDWMCTCHLIAGHDVHSTECALADAITVHERHEEQAYTASEPIRVGRRRRWMATLRRASALPQLQPESGQR